MSKQTIAVDIDDVLSTNAQDFIAYTNARWGTRLTIEDYDEHWGEVWQVEREEAHERASEYLLGDTMGSYGQHDYAYEALKKLHEMYRIIIVTSRGKIIEKNTQDWLRKHFDGCIDEVFFAGIYDTSPDDDDEYHSRYKKTKGTLLKELGADYFVDDQPKHCIAADELGITTILFGDYAWNRQAEIPTSMIRCKTWRDVCAYFGV